MVVVAGALGGCAPRGLAFKVDERLTFTAPRDRATVSLPVTIEWQIKDFAVTDPGSEVSAGTGYFAVFVDAIPMPPGESLRWVARKDDGCREADGCPGTEYLNSRGVYPTTATKLTLDQLPRTGKKDRRERHRVTVVLLDPKGSRIGESAFELTFDVQRKVQS